MKYTVITGASSGIGKEMAIKFAKEGHNLILVARRDNLLKELKNNILKDSKVDIIIFKYDLSKIENVHKFYNGIKKYDVDVLINNAGVGNFDNIWDIDVVKNEMMIDLNIKALSSLTILFVKDNIKKEATIINVSSVVGYRISESSLHYSATKFYVSAFSEGIDKILKNAKSKLRIKILAPGPTETEFGQHALEGTKYDKKTVEEWTKKFESRMKPASELAGYAYDLYKSNKVLGIIDDKSNKFVLKDGQYPVY